MFFTSSRDDVKALSIVPSSAPQQGVAHFGTFPVPTPSDGRRVEFLSPVGPERSGGALALDRGEHGDKSTHLSGKYLDKHEYILIR